MAQTVTAAGMDAQLCPLQGFKHFRQ